MKISRISNIIIRLHLYLSESLSMTRCITSQNNISNIEVADREALAPAMMVIGARLEWGRPFKADLLAAHGPLELGLLRLVGVTLAPTTRPFFRTQQFEAGERSSKLLRILLQKLIVGTDFKIKKFVYAHSFFYISKHLYIYIFFRNKNFLKRDKVKYNKIERKLNPFDPAYRLYARRS